MIDMDEIRKEIKKLESGPTTFSNCEKLAMLYTICDHAKGIEMANAYERREEKREKTEAKKAKWAEPEYTTSYSMPEAKTFDMAMADEWTASMKNEDGTKGPHWTIEQVKQVMAQKGIKGEPYEFYAVLNMIYSDYCAVLKKHRVNNLDVYVDLACAWLMDEDAVSDKSYAYYENVVKHA